MKEINELDLGFNDAENYKRKENKTLFNSVFIKNRFLEELYNQSNYFLIGEKGTGKTAYAVYLQNNKKTKDTISVLKYLRETDYKKFIQLKKEKHLQLSDYASIWKVIILLLLADSIEEDELKFYQWSKTKKIKSLKNSILEYYASAFSPEIINALQFVEGNRLAAELISKHMTLNGESSHQYTFEEKRFQVNLLYIEKQFKDAIADIKIKDNHFLFIDGIDIRPGEIPYAEYLECVKGLADAVWSLNNDFFSSIKDSKGRFKVVLLIRPDIFHSLGFQNSTNKIRDNSVFLDWRTTYPQYRNSDIFKLTDKLLANGISSTEDHGYYWDKYFPWRNPTTSPKREYDPSFHEMLKISYSRPRDMVTILQILQGLYLKQNKKYIYFEKSLIHSHEFKNEFSAYLMGGIRDQLSFYYSNDDYETFLTFFNFLEGKSSFDYTEYSNAYEKFAQHIYDNLKDNIPEFVDSKDTFLQFLYDTNIICYIEESNFERYIRWCYRERSISNISPKVKTGLTYQIHYGLMKELNLGQAMKKR